MTIPVYESQLGARILWKQKWIAEVYVTFALSVLVGRRLRLSLEVFAFSNKLYIYVTN